jgi:non-ribosomal peptide synthetase component F/thioesterase domain-containing protein/acyl carrier protein
VTGELYIGGAGVARGYLGRPALTAERFLADPFGKTPGGRMYRTGDLARWRPDGALECLGRADHQVKVRGFRIELGEIEAALAAHADVREAAVVARGDATGEHALAAYLVFRDGAPPGVAALRAWLLRSLPEYMVPGRFTVLQALPLTPNGKIDRNALPDPSGGLAAPGTPYEAPRTPAEAAIAAVWAQVLRVERVGVHDHFFDLGGHSLLATQVVSRLREALGVEVPVRVLFEAPTVSELAARVGAEGANPRPENVAPIVPLPRNGALPLSFAQQALWFIEQLAPREPTFNVAAAVRVAGPLDADALARSLDAMVQRHEVLRSTFVPVAGRPVLRIAAALDVPLVRDDLSGLDAEAREAEARRLADAEARRPFDLARGPLVRARLLTLGAADHALLLTMHHIITDGWSFGVAATELSALYEAFRAGRPSPLAETTVQYADYAAWQRARLQGPVLDALLGYWTDRLQGLPVLELPTDRPRPAVRSARGSARAFTLSAGLSDAVRALGRGAGATPFMTLLAAFQVVLARYSGQVDFAVGTPVANRTRTEVEGLIGYFVNMLVLRADLAGDPTFRDLLGRVRDTSLAAFQHQELPLDVLAQTLRPARDPSRTPLFQVMFVLQNNLMPSAIPEGLTLAPLDTSEGTGTAKFDLTLGLSEAPDGPFHAVLEYSTDLFDEATAAGLVDHFQTLLADATAHPERRLSELSLLPEAERRRVLYEWNATESPVPEGLCVHHLVEAQAKRTPDALAVVGGGRTLTYRDLNERANRLANHLRRLGVGPEVRVGLALERSREQMIGLLAILKAGGAYLPLDPTYPRERLRLMADDAGITVLLTRRGLRGSLPSSRARFVFLDTDDYFIEQQCGDDPDGGAAPGNAAYVLYTSGSTGTPKGVVVTHRNLVNHNLAAARLFELKPGERVLQFGSIGFDLAAEEIFPTWASGATLVLRDDEALDLARFAHWIGRARVNVVDLPTAFWHAWVKSLAGGVAGAECPGPPDVPGTGASKTPPQPPRSARESEIVGPLPDGLRLVVVGGEEASSALLAAWRSAVGTRVRWLNTYGPTEATIIVTADEPPPDDDARHHRPGVPVGRPIANTRAYVLDEALRPVPVGLPGELYLAGEGVARGYLKRPSLTAERFLPDPYGPRPGGRMYRTGDRARWRPDGRLEYLGRADDQVKVRGFRVEPGEVEAVLLARPDVRQAAVTRHDDGAGGALVAHVVAPGLTADVLRKDLRDRLPAHMVPSAIVFLDDLPLTPSGKVDRRTLPPPDLVATTAPHDARPPADDVEARLVTLWEELLPTRPVGVADNFFDIGGHSLLAARLLSRVEEEFGRPLPLASLLRGATIEDLAVLLREQPDARPWNPLVPIQPAGAGRPFFCVHPGGGIVYCYQELARRLGTDQPFYGLQASGLDAGTEPFDRIEPMAARYIAAVRAVQPAGPYRLGGWSLGGLVAYEMACQLRAQGEEVSELVIFDTPAPPPARPEIPPRVRALAGEIAALELFGPAAGGDPLDDAVVVAEYASDVVPGGWGVLPRLVRQLGRLDPDERRRLFLKEFNLDQVYHQDVGPGRMNRLLKVIRAHVVAGVRYTPRPYPGRVTLFRCSSGLAAWFRSETLGWDALARRGVTTHTVATDHDSLLGAAGVETIAGVLRSGRDGGECEP